VKYLRCGLVCAIVLIVTLCALPHRSLAANKFWNGLSGNWSLDSNWDPFGRPNDGDDCFLNTAFGHVVTYDLTDAVHTYGGVLIRGMELKMNQPFNAAGLTMGDFGVASTFTVGSGVQSSITAFGIGTNSLLNLFPGTVTISTINQVGGQIVGHPTRTILNGFYQMTGGSLSGGMSNYGTFINDGGILASPANGSDEFINYGTMIINRPNDTSNIFLRNSGHVFATQIASASFGSVLNTGTFSLQPGSLTVRETFGQSVGGVTIQQGSMQGGLSLSGFWHQQGNTFRVHTTSFAPSGMFNIGQSGAGTFQLSAGTVLLNETGQQLGPMRVGYTGDGTFLHDNGTVQSNGSFIIGTGGGRGYYRMSNGTFRMSRLIVNDRTGASGTFVQTGGFTSAQAPVEDNLVVNEEGIGTALVDLSGGSSSFGSVINHGSLLVRGTHAMALYTLVGLGDLSVSGAGTMRVTLVRQNSLTIGAGGTIRGNPEFFNVQGTHRLRSFAIAESGDNVLGTWDIENGKLVVDYTGASPVASIRKYLASGHAAGAWNGPGLQSSKAADNSAHNTALGYAEASQIFGVGGGVFAGVAVDDSAVLVKYTYYGDTDLNGKINFDDYVRTDNGFNNHLSGWFNGDFNYNGVVNFDDYVLLDLAFNTQSGTLGRALRLLDGAELGHDHMNDPALRLVRDHFQRFGEAYASSFTAAVPEPGVAVVACSVSACIATASRRRRPRHSPSTGCDHGRWKRYSPKPNVSLPHRRYVFRQARMCSSIASRSASSVFSCAYSSTEREYRHS
jgi:hypothetical protein